MMSRNTRWLTVLQINDTHGYLEPHPELVWHGRSPFFPILGGYARIAGFFRAVRLERPGAVLALDNGDAFHGTYPAVSSKGEALVPLTGARDRRLRADLMHGAELRERQETSVGRTTP